MLGPIRTTAIIIGEKAAMIIAEEFAIGPLRAFNVFLGDVKEFSHVRKLLSLSALRTPGGAQKPVIRRSRSFVP
jgi:hypothetical protein